MPGAANGVACEVCSSQPVATAASTRLTHHFFAMMASASLERFTSQPITKAVKKPTLAGSCGNSELSGVGMPIQ